ncbi:basement membrane-specific heparan sulfate proteoglycan core protein-like [Melanotaenia boesemani]|uniref:basement membrane-specific heparan sulfate proteoglycan core protein-like n=1 Tax=Melanotaenia boesemani TaxID=1250792 RepID=UPI001C043B51|nr:basement membrane-specific heparan sulfate proteoglycan core protein-like [Melanotaenia boesemani]
MRCTAAVNGFFTFLLCAAVVQGQDDWGVTYSSAEICALKGSTVEIHGTYRHPTREKDLNVSVTEAFWLVHADNEPVDLKSEAEYAGRVQDHCDEDGCTLTISDLRESDSAEYRFRFITNQPGGSFTGSPGVVLTVSGSRSLFYLDPKVKITQSTFTNHHLQCNIGCFLPGSPKFVWYKNGKKMSEQNFTYSDSFRPKDSVSCAVRGHEDFPSAPFCKTQSCDKVFYNERRICAIKGSSVDISVTYTQPSIKSKFWFSPGRSHRWRSHSQPEDLKNDPQYSNHVQVSEGRKSSTLTIYNLTESDSAEYRFALKTSGSGWGTDLHGTTLTVTALQVQVTRIFAAQNVVLAQLKCHSSCAPADHHSFIWFKNRRKISEDTNSYKDIIYPEDKISCAIKQNNHRAPAVYAPNSPSVSVSPAGEIIVGHFVSLTCISYANPAANYSWYKKNRPSALQPPSKDPQFVFSSIQPSDSGEYYCSAENEMGRRTSGYAVIGLKYAPKPPLPSATSSVETDEGSSVTLTCISNTNLAPNYTWYKENQTLLQRDDNIYNFIADKWIHSGLYLCTSMNKHDQGTSSTGHADVQYVPQFLSMSVSPSGELVEGASVTLTCISDGDPAANNTWHKVDKDSPKSSGQTFIITDVRSEHGGIYNCEAQHGRGQKFSPHSNTASSSMKSAVAGSISAMFVTIILVFSCIVIGRQRSPKQSSESRGRLDISAPHNMAPESDMLAAVLRPPEEQDELHYASVCFIKNEDDPLFSNIVLTQLKDEHGEYMLVNVVTPSPD